MVKTSLTLASCLILILTLKAEAPAEPSAAEQALKKVEECLKTQRAAQDALKAAGDQCEKVKNSPDEARIAATRRQAAQLMLKAADDELALAMSRLQAATGTKPPAGEGRDFRDHGNRSDKWSGKWSYEFNVGYEFATVNKLFEEGFPRTGLLIYRTFVPPNDEKGWGWHGFDLFGNFQLTSSAEQKITDATSSDGGEKTLEFEGGLFFPLYKGDFFSLNEQKEKYEYFGPVAVAGARHTDDEDDVDGRYYGGARLAKGPQHFLDLLAGATEGLDSGRLEVRGQFPMFDIAGSTVYLGAIGNFGISTGEEDEEDVIRVYLQWGLDPSGFFGKFKAPGSSSE